MARDRVVWCVRRDLRLNHNRTLLEAKAARAEVVPLFVVDPTLIANAGERRVAFLLDAVRWLRIATGQTLTVREGKPEEEVAAVAREVGATRVVAQAVASPYAKRRDGRVAKSVRLDLVGGPWIFGPDAVLKADGMPYTVFTPYLKGGVRRCSTG